MAPKIRWRDSTGLQAAYDEFTLHRMDGFREFGRLLLIAGGALILAGAFFFFEGKLPFRVGRLPGDIVHEGEHTRFYFPIATCLVLSAGLSVIFWLIARLRR